MTLLIPDNLINIHGQPWKPPAQSLIKRDAPKRDAPKREQPAEFYKGWQRFDFCSHFDVAVDTIRSRLGTKKPRIRASSSFNVQIADQASSDRTNSIAGRA